MMRRAIHTAIILLLLLSSRQMAVAQQRNVLTIADDHLVLHVDLQSSKIGLDSLFKLAGVDISDINKFLKGDYSAFKNDGWTQAGREGNIIEFDKPLTDVDNNPQNEPYEITTRIPSIDGKPGYPTEVKYGVNRFARVTVYNLASGFTRFIFPGHTRAKRVFLSGNFNDWSTLKGLMTKTDGGWLLDIKLAAGTYEYKYIVDGRWTTDPNNLSRTEDGDGNDNSVFYKYNYTFKLPGYASAHKVTLAGDFNNWDSNGITMEKTGTGWRREVYLDEGLHQYRFMVDGAWVTDPANAVKEKDNDGNTNSVLNLGLITNFKLPGYSNAKKVVLTGDFNHWDTEKLILKRNGDAWVLPVTLPKGNYKYNFIVDGRWITDPANAHQIVEDNRASSILSIKPSHTFKLKGYADAKKIILAGTFNNWNPNGYTMEHLGDVWTIDLYLKPGKYLYKFVIDGNWIIDPGNKYWERNDENTGNSVLWME